MSRVGAWWAGLDRLAYALIFSGLIAAALVIAAMVAWWHTYWGQWISQNVLPPSLWTLLGIGVAHLRLHKKLDAHHEALKAHVTAVAGKEGT